MRNNEYTATPNWFKQESTDSLASVYQTNYYLTGSTSSGSGMSSINLYNKYIINTYKLTVDDLFIPNTAIIAVDSELPEGLEPPEDFVSEVGNNVEATNWHTSYLISVVSGTNLIANLKANSNRYGIVFYDEYNQPISGYTPTVDELATIPVPENARYFRCCHYIEPVIESVEEPVEPTYEFYIEYTGMGNYEDSDLNTAYGGIFENFTNVNSSVPEGINTKLLSTSGLNLIFLQPLSCTVDKSNNIKIGLDKVFTDSKVLDLWKLIEDEQGNKYIITDYNVVGKGGITAYYNDDLNPGGDGGLGGGGSIVNIQIIGEGNVLSDVTLSEDKSLLTFTKSEIEELNLWKLIEDEQGNKYIVTDYNIVGRGGITAYYDGDLTPGSGGGLGGGTILDIEIKGEGNALVNVYLNEDKSILNFDRGYLMDLTTEQTSTALKTFTEGIKIGDTLIKVIDGVLTLDCSLAVTGGITAYALGEQTASSIMDAIICDDTTIAVIDGKLTVIGGTGGASNWDELEGKPSWITDTKPTYAWGEIAQKPTTLSGYGIQASDVLNTLKSVDGSGSGLDADTLDGKHLSTAESIFNGIAYTAGDGVMEIGRYLDFHYDSTDTSDYSTRLCISSKGNSNTVNLPTKTGTLALTTDNVASATKLQTARTIWGQSFDGTANVTGSLTSVTDITGTGTFTGANIKATDSVYVNGIRLHKTADGVITLEGNLAVTGGITQFAVNEVSSSTIMDGVVVDGTSIKKENGVLKVMNAGGGEAGSVKWANITDKPVTLAGYGVSASDVLSTLKTVDGNNSGLDADMLDGVHNGYVSGKLHTYDLPYTDQDKKNYWVKIATLRLTYQYTSQEAILLISERYTLTSISYYAFVSVRIQQQNSMGRIPNVSLKAFGSISNSNIVGILNYNSSSSTLDVYYREVNVYQRGYVSYVQGTADIRTNSQELIATLPSGTQIISTNDCRCGYSDNADKLDGVQLNGLFTALSSSSETNLSITIGNVTKTIADLYATQAVNADKLDGVHLNGIFTAFTASGNNTRLTIGGVTKDLTVPYATNADMLDGVHLMGAGGRTGILRSWSRGTFTSANQYFGNGSVVTIDPRGTGCVSANDTILSLGDLNIRNTQLLFPYDRNRIYYRRIVDDGYGSWLSLAFLHDNVASATKLHTARKIWGQSFDGTKDVTGSMTVNGNITIANKGIVYGTGTNGGFGIIPGHVSGECIRIDCHNSSGKWITNGIIILLNGYTGIGMPTPSQKLHVAGNILATGGGTFYSSDIRAKTIIERPKLSLNSIANAPVIKFRWNGYNGLKDDNKQHVGGVAQYIEKILPECVVGQKDDFLSFDYATVGYVFSVQTARHLQSYETKTDREIKKLKNRITFLEKQLKKLGYEEINIMAD